MKVICIDAAHVEGCWVCGRSSGYLNENDVYVVTDEEKDYFIIQGLERCTCGQLHSYFKRRFIPLSEIDETEFVREENLVNH